MRYFLEISRKIQAYKCLSFNKHLNKTMQRSTDSQKAEQKKQLGNAEFKKGNHSAAINYYTDALGKYSFY
jgi:hypothetical protein